MVYFMMCKTCGFSSEKWYQNPILQPILRCQFVVWFEKKPCVDGGKCTSSNSRAGFWVEGNEDEQLAFAFFFSHVTWEE